MKKRNYYILLILSIIFIVFTLNYVSENNITKDDILGNLSNSSLLEDLSDMINITENTNTISEKVKESNFFTIINETKIRDNFIEELQEKRKEAGKKEIVYSKTLERKAQSCAKDTLRDCIIEYYQEGIGWQIPWYTDVIGCGNAFGNKNNPSCLLESLEEDNDPTTRIYPELFSRNKIGVGVYHLEKSNEISYWIILE